MLTENRKQIAGCEVGNAFAHGLHGAPTLVTQATRFGRELHPVGPSPGLEVRGADAAALEPHADLTRAGLRERERPDFDLPRSRWSRSPQDTSDPDGLRLGCGFGVSTETIRKVYFVHE